MLSLKDFKATEINGLNKFSGGKKKTKWTSGSTGTDYNDYDFGPGEVDTTTWGVGSSGNKDDDKTYEPYDG